MQDIGDDKQALEVYRRALALYPRMERIPDIVKTLRKRSRAGIFNALRRPSIANFPADIGNPQHIGCARCAERHAGHDDHALTGFGEAFLEGDAAGAVDHVILVVRIFGDHAMHAPDDGQAPSGRDIR